MKKKISNKIKMILLSLLGIMILFPVISFFVRSSIYQTDKDAQPITDLSNYQNWSADGWIYEEPYRIFPATSVPAQAVRADYLFKRVRAQMPLLYDDDALVYLACNLDEETFSNEIKRLKELCGNSRDDFEYRGAYVCAVRGGGLFYEYALIEEELHRIVYISFQNREFAKQYIDSSLLPNR